MVDSATHIGVGEMAEYVCGGVTRDRDTEISAHLKSCEPCSRRALDLLDLSLEWEEWVAFGHRAVEASQPLAILKKADLSGLGADPQSLADRLTRWIKMGAELAVSVELPSLDSATRFTVSQLESILSASAQFVPRKVAAFRGQEIEGPILVIPGEGRRRARVVVEALESATQVSVQLENVPAGTPLPLVAIERKDTGEVFVKEMAVVPSAVAGTGDTINLAVDFDLTGSSAEIFVVMEPLKCRAGKVISFDETA
jgi:hypothetical protein